MSESSGAKRRRANHESRRAQRELRTLRRYVIALAVSHGVVLAGYGWIDSKDAVLRLGVAIVFLAAIIQIRRRPIPWTVAVAVTHGASCAIPFFPDGMRGLWFAFELSGQPGLPPSVAVFGKILFLVMFFVVMAWTLTVVTGPIAIVVAAVFAVACGVTFRALVRAERAMKEFRAEDAMSDTPHHR